MKMQRREYRANEVGKIYDDIDHVLRAVIAKKKSIPGEGAGASNHVKLRSW